MMRLFRTLLFLTSALSGVLSDSCDCDHKNSRGCVISESAPKGKACKCISGGVRCDGEITECIDPSSKYCQSPDDSIWSCLQGGGDCDGYDDYPKCDCKHDRGAGCIITDLPPKGVGCYCDRYTLIGIVGFACTGTDVLCSQPLSAPCLNPAANIATCLQGKGNCDGYTDTCECIPSVTVFPPAVACKIVTPSPPNTACRCQLAIAANSSVIPDALKLGTCAGTIVTCKDPSSPKCLKPDTSEASCLQGGGACAYESGQTSPLVYKASLRGAQAARPSASNNMTGLVSVTLHNTTYGSGYLFATNVVQMTQAFFWFDQGGQKFPLVWVFNGTYGPVSGSIKVSFTFNPSVNKVSLLLASGLVYFDVNTAAHTTGGLGVQLAGPSFKVYTNGTAGLQFGSAAPILGGVAHTTGGLGF